LQDRHPAFSFGSNRELRRCHGFEERSLRRPGDRAFAIANVPMLEKYKVVVVEAKAGLGDWR
jgi:hypothetical protein